MIFPQAKQKTYDKLNLGIKNDIYALKKMGQMCNKTVQLGFDIS